MPRQLICHGRTTQVLPGEFPADFPERLVRFKEEWRLPWGETALRPGVYRHAVWPWQSGGMRPNGEHMMALLDLADDFSTGHLFTEEEGAIPSLTLLVG